MPINGQLLVTYKCCDLVEHIVSTTLQEQSELQQSLTDFFSREKTRDATSGKPKDNVGSCRGCRPRLSRFLLRLASVGERLALCLQISKDAC